MNINQLEYFCTSVECGSITKAAKKLHVTQPAISGAIRELEKEFSVTLFSHTRNKLALCKRVVSASDSSCVFRRGQV